MGLPGCPASRPCKVSVLGTWRLLKEASVSASNGPSTVTVELQ